MRKIVATRGSPLAKVQTEAIVSLLRRARPDVEFVIKEVRTQGDIARDAALASLPRGVFAKELELALAAGEADIAVHSFKDLPTNLAPGFTIAAITEREDPRDVLIAERPLKDLPQGSAIGTSSPRRTAQLRAYRPDLRLVPVRGNVGTRIEKARRDGLDGVVLAAAGVHRLGLRHEITEYLDPAFSTPEAGQGALAIEVRDGDQETAAIAAVVDHPPSRARVTAEVSTLKVLGGGCKVPIAVYAEAANGDLRLRGMVSDLTGRRLIRATAEGEMASPQTAGSLLAERLIEMGAREILAEAEA